MNQVKIKKRKLKEEEITILIDEIQKTPFMNGHSKREWRKFSDVFVAEMKDKLAGVCVAIDLGFNWVEIGAILVLGEHRGMKIGKQLFNITFDYAESKKNIYMVSRNPIVKKWMFDKKMILANHVFNLPFPIIWHDIIMFFSLYRILEFFRKSVLFRHKSEYIYGYKIVK